MQNCFRKGRVPISEEKKKASQARIRANAKYNAKAYDQIGITVKKGRKEELKLHAAKRGESLNGFVNRAILETEQRDNEGEATARQ